MYEYKFNNSSPYDIISNNFLSEKDIFNIHIVEDAFDYYYNKDYFKNSINFILDNISNPFEFFFNLGKLPQESKRLENTFRVLDTFIKHHYPLIYDHFHELVIIDYLNCFTIKPGSWWEETILPKDKNNLIRLYHKNELNKLDINILYKYSLVIPLRHTILIALYINNKLTLYKIKRS